MVNFIEFDAAGNIVHVCKDPSATITPVINRAKFMDKNGNEFKDSTGKDASHLYKAMQPPVSISDAEFTLLMTTGIDNFVYDFTTKAVVPKV